MANQAQAYHHAADVPETVTLALVQNEAAANIILPFLNKARDFPRGDVSKQLWVVDDAKNVNFVLSCTRGVMGDYPIFIFARKTATQLAEEEGCGGNLDNALLPLVRLLLEHVPPQRVFSIFSVAKVSEAFARVFVAQMHPGDGIRAVEVPFYDATFTFCTNKTFKSSLNVEYRARESEEITISLCRADMSHLNGVAALCKEFSETSPPYELDDERAKLEASTMITNQQLWLHMVQQNSDEPEIACLVATTRESTNVTAVTKVVTAKKWQARGCATRLLHRVCSDLLRQKQRLVLYVGNSAEMGFTRGMYRKVGFQGLDGQGQQVEGVERWIEIGFEGTHLGYW